MSAPHPAHWRETLFLPRTKFGMKAKLVQLEEKLLARWAAMDVSRRQREAGDKRVPFILHDGPPYANGALHLGSALNKILKDFINRSQFALGKDIRYVPGWDCHGLPIEWQVEEAARGKGATRKTLGQAEMRRRCRAHAEKWVAVQKKQFRRLGVGGNWDAPYLTMMPSSQAAIAGEAMRAAATGAVYQARMPVMWSPIEQTALAEAEVEYKEHSSPAIWVRFPLGQGISALIWTTTPWTIPANRALAFGADLSYGIYQVKKVEEGSLAQIGERLLLADSRAEAVREAGKIIEWERHDAPDLATRKAAHPLCGWPNKEDYDFPVPLLAADFVADDAGTGLVHVAPGHGPDDYALGRRHGLDAPDSVDEAGRLTKAAPGFAGAAILPPDGAKKSKSAANEAVIEALETKGKLLARSTLRHDYPHSWRSKAPVIFRAAPQWFISMEKTQLRKKALAALEEVKFYPERGRTRLTSMIKTRPDWVISRQRAWGVPLPFFIDKKSGDLLLDDAVNERILAAITQDGAQAWFADDAPQRFLAPDYDPEAYRQVQDILDVWFDSGSTHAFVLEARDELTSPADLYLEGSDQHRGWFQSSLLESCLTRGSAPYRAILTHGFVLDKNGRKMSKSMGNFVSPEELWQQKGADILRLWAALADSREDIKFSWESIDSAVELYRKIRNGLRFALGNLHGFSEEERVGREAMPDLEKFMLHRLAEVEATWRAHWQAYAPRPALEGVAQFILQDLSPFYFDIRKDVLYCEAADSSLRRACRSVLDEIAQRLEIWLAPILCFTAEEAFLARHGADIEDETYRDSVHLARLPEIPKNWHDEALAQKFQQIRLVRRVITGALEQARQQGEIGSSLEARFQLWLESPSLAKNLHAVDWAELAITSKAELGQGEAPANAFRLAEVAGVAVLVSKAQGEACARSWKITQDIGADKEYPTLSLRDAQAVRAFYAAQAGKA